MGIEGRPDLSKDISGIVGPPTWGEREKRAGLVRTTLAEPLQSQIESWNPAAIEVELAAEKGRPVLKERTVIHQKLLVVVEREVQYIILDLAEVGVRREHAGDILAQVVTHIEPARKL